VSVWAVVVAAGTGSRFGGTKQYELIAGRSVLEWSLVAAGRACDGVVAVIPPGDVGRRPLPVSRPPDAIAAGGATRSASVRAGLAEIPESAAIVVVHDAARPLAPPSVWDAVIGAVRDGADAAICAVPVSDTVKRVRDGVVVATIERDDLVAVQTPQAFRAAVLRAAHAGEPEATDDAAVIEAAGGRVVVVPGSALNLKITHPHDLAVAGVLAAWS
jgi:2-C-methyl-D-erythritol 4-phosphate cytidylyltransferase